MLYGKNGEQKMALLEDKLYDYMNEKYLKQLDKETNRYVYDFNWAKSFLSGNK